MTEPKKRLITRLWGWTKRQKWKLLLVFAALSFCYYICLPKQLFNDPTSTVLFDKEGELLGAKIALDEQWRFPETDTVPEKFKKAIVAFEDKRFYSHWGVDPFAIGRALWLNASTGEVKSGGSTLTMQTMRLSRKNPARTVWEKIKESLLASRLEWSYSKDEILAKYASHAPFGGNVVGLDAAAWKYFGRSANKLSWAEASMLAVLPNSPSLIHLGRNREKLKTKRDRLLEVLRDEGEMDSLTCELAKLETLPEKPKALPRLAPHLLERVHREQVLAGGQNGIIHSTINAQLQAQVTEVVDRHYQRLKRNQIHNAAALVIDVQTGDVVAYVGNAPNTLEEHGAQVDIIPAQRSTGSILKPFLYAGMLHDGEMLPKTLFPDVPSQFGGYSPKNFDSQYSGAVQADDVLTRSLNIPSVHMLQQYTAMRFQHKLKQIGMTTLNHAPSHYGLTLVLGGAETTLWDLGAMYSGMARNLKNFYPYNGRYDPNNFRSLNYLQEKSKGQLSSEEAMQLQESTALNAAAIWHSFEAMQELTRPGMEGFWKNFASSSRVAWKTGTSFGFRDAWAVGCTPRYVVAVWAGNADGEGRPGLVGVQAAAPLLFDIFHVLGPSREWFESPLDEMQPVATCHHSGHRCSEYCTEIDTLWSPRRSLKTKICPYHKRVHLDISKKNRLHSDCESPLNMVHENYFVLPPAQEWYYKQNSPDYRTLPPYREDCKATLSGGRRSMVLIYPQEKTKIYVPRKLDETKSRTVFEVAHSDASKIIYWHLDDKYIGRTQHFHQLALNPQVGEHTITLVDEDGQSLSRRFEILPEDS